MTKRRQGCINESEKKFLADTHPHLIHVWNYELNNLNPNNITYGSDKKVWWHCDLCNQDYCMSPHTKTGMNQGCPYCAGKRVYFGNSLANKRPDLVEFWHSSKNGELKPEHIIAGTHKKVWWFCDVCLQSYKTDVHNRQITGCPYCANKKAYVGNCLATKYPEISRFWHPTKNGKITTKDVLPFSRKDAWWICSSCADEFLLKIRRVTAGNKTLVLCNKCSAYYHEELCRNIMFEIFDKKFVKTKRTTMMRVKISGVWIMGF